MTELARCHATVVGDVQGVGFRAYVMQRGVILGITGWARNLPDGRVEVVAEGEREKLEQLLVHLRAGPRVATVESVEYQWEPITGEYHFFSIH